MKRNTFWGIVVVLLGFGIVHAEEKLADYSWRSLKESGKVAVGELVSETRTGGTVDALKLSSDRPEGKTFEILQIEGPAITKATYALLSDIRYEGVTGPAYLEMWSVFADDSRFFSRTLDVTGPLARLSGTSDWRPVSLPFFNEQGSAPPSKLIVNLVLPGPGTVWLGPMRLMQFEPNESLYRVPGQWWEERTAGLIGGIAGSIFGCLGALVGILASRHSARGVVMGTLGFMAVSGFAAGIAGVAALIVKQPYAVYYPLLLFGLLGTVLPLSLMPSLRRRYAEAELRRMQAIDA